jgi:Tfp pilus assembly protein PilF
MGTALLFAALVFAQTGARVGPDAADLRQSCDAASAVVARLPPGTPLRLHSSIAGAGGVCFRVSTDSQTGYLWQTQIASLDEYEAARRGASADGGLPSEIRSAAIRDARAPSLPRAVELLEARQPRQALQLIEYAIRQEGATGAGVLALAGLAALQSDQPAKAQTYFRQSLALEPNPHVAALAERAARESANDTSAHVLHGGRFVLRYDQQTLPPSTAHLLLGALETEYTRLDAAIGCHLGEQVTAVVHTPERYRAATGAAEWSGGVYDGLIRVAAPEGATVTANLRRTLAHEIVHACLARRGAFPAWFHEGMAQHWSGERLSAPQHRALREKLAAGALPPLAQLQAGWGAFTPTQAALAYAYALAAVETLYSTRGEAHVRDLLRTPSLLDRTAEELTRALTP